MEIWNDIKGYEGLYQVSTYGSVRSLGKGKTWKTHKIIKSRDNGHGYYMVGLSKEGVLKHHYIHRLVAEAFIPNWFDDTQVNHRDEDKSNNNVDNLEWCDGKYNINYGTCKKRISEKNTNSCGSKKVVQYTVDGSYINEYPSIKEAVRQTGFKHQNISACCKGLYKTTNGFIFLFNDDSDELSNRIKNLARKKTMFTKEHRQKIINKLTNGKKSKPVLQYTMDGEFVREWPSMSEIRRIYGYNVGSISNCCRGLCKYVYGYIWKYKK